MAEDTPIVLRRVGEPWRRPPVGSYPNERGLQELLVESPTLIPGVGPAAAVDELHLPDGGSVDIVAVEPSGAVTLVECKLAANSEVRRAVVGQILSYAAALWQLPYDQLDSRFHQRAGLSLSDAVEQVANEQESGWDAEEFRRAVADNLAVGSFRLFIAVDVITDELKRIVEYLNTHTTSELEVLALELAYVTDDGLEILLPRTHGMETARIKWAGASRSKPNWSVDDVFTKLDELCSVEGVAAVRQLYDDVLARGGKVYTGKGSYPTLSAYLEFNGELRAVWAVYADPSGPTAPRISLNFGSWRKSLDDEALEAITSHLERSEVLAPVLTSVRGVGFDTYMSVRIDDQLAQGGTVATIIEALDPFLPPRTV